MEISQRKIIYFLNYLYITFNFIIFTNSKFINLLSDFYLILMFYFLFIYFLKNKLTVSKKICIIFIFFFLLLFVQIIFNQYGYYDLFRTTLFALIVYFVFNGDVLGSNYKPNKDFLYWAICIYLIYYLIASYYNGVLLSSSYNFYLLCCPDKNLSALIIFLFMCFCYNNKKKTGVIISIIYTFLLKSRMTQFGVILFLLLSMINKQKLRKVIRALNVKSIFSIIIISQVMLIAISYYCTFNIPTYKISDYRESLVDSSNSMRVRANVYAVELIKKDNKLLYRGYDRQLKNVLGIEDIYNSKIYLGFRLVQPHSLLLNMILRYGLIYSLVYILFISVLIHQFLNEKNFSFVCVYLIINAILPLLFTASYLIFFMFVIYTFKLDKENSKLIGEY